MKGPHLKNMEPYDHLVNWSIFLVIWKAMGSDALSNAANSLKDFYEPTFPAFELIHFP